MVVSAPSVAREKQLSMQNKKTTTSGGILKSVGTKNCLYAVKKTCAGLALHLAVVLILLIVAAEVCFGAVYSGIYVVNSSMLYTLTGATSEDSAGGDFIYINRLASPSYSDIVVVYDAHMNSGAGEYIIKRAVAFGGDTVKMESGKLYIKYKGTEEFVYVQEDYVSAANNWPTLQKNSFEEHLVADGCMFLLGDNRNVSNDSRNSENGVNGDYSYDCLLGVVPGWSMAMKSFTTAWHTFFYFTLPSFFGIS